MLGIFSEYRNALRKLWVETKTRYHFGKDSAASISIYRLTSKWLELVALPLITFVLFFHIGYVFTFQETYTIDMTAATKKHCVSLLHDTTNPGAWVQVENEYGKVFNVVCIRERGDQVSFMFQPEITARQYPRTYSEGDEVCPEKLQDKVRYYSITVLYDTDLREFHSTGKQIPPELKKKRILQHTVSLWVQHEYEKRVENVPWICDTNEHEEAESILSFK